MSKQLQCSVLVHWFPSFRVHFYGACLHVRFVAFGLQWFPSVHFVFTCRPQCVRRYVYTAFRLLSCFPLVAFICRLQCDTLCSSTAVFLRELSVRTVYSACLYCNTLLCIGPCRLQCMSLRQHCVPSTAFVFARVLCSCHLPSTVLFTTHHVPFESLSFTRVPKYGIC